MELLVFQPYLPFGCSNIANMYICLLTADCLFHSEKAPKQVPAVQHCYAEVRLGQESQRKISLEGDSTGLGVRSKSYNVVMVGDASVGKTSFMKRAQSGKFSLDLPSSVGLDSCMWTVVVDGKPVVLQLWDTAGQERFRSITRQIFHKAHAFLLMYDIASSQSFSAVSYWADCIQVWGISSFSKMLSLLFRALYNVFYRC
uniref:Uncharacterized protein n=1 Tax=Monopterus albus TaxID=43700 RepID=A0A3Q3KBS4_MONAL